MKTHIYLSVLLLQFPLGNAVSQQYEYVHRNKDSPNVNCYLKIVPSGKVRGLVIRDVRTLPDTSDKSPFRLTGLATQNNLMTIYTVTSGYFPELYYGDQCMHLLDSMVAEAMAAHQVPKQNIFIGGISASGTRALRYAQFCRQGKSVFGHTVKGVFAVDPPLDLARFYRSAALHRSNFKEGMREEADIVLKAFPEKLNGTPDKVPENYYRASVFSHNDSLGQYTKPLKDQHILLFHEPDIDWWLSQRGASYYDINSFDIAAFVVQLRSLGNSTIDLVTTTGKGFDREGKRNCHSWGIVDEDFLIQWILERAE